MKIAAIEFNGRLRLALVEDGTFRVAPEEFGDLIQLVAEGDGALRRFVEASRKFEELQFDASLLRAPVQSFRRDILCAGWNYWDHFEEGRGRRDGQEVERPEHPTFFTKGPDVVVDPYGAVAFDPEISGKWDYEVEMALVIGRGGRSIPESQALGHVFGYCLANDISQRDLQRAHGGQWLKGKSIDMTMPLGPFITTADEIDPQAVEIECVVNGEVLQSASTQLMAFPVARLISELSHGMTLRPGDLVLTGTPAGVGNARTPQRFLSSGDVVISRSPQLGEMRNELVTTDLHSPRT